MSEGGYSPEEARPTPDQPSAENKPKLPGGAARAKPLEINGQFYDPYHPPKLVRKTDGTEEYVGGKTIDRDTIYANRFWDRQPKGMKEVMIQELHKAAADPRGKIGSFVNPSGMDERDKEKLSAYRQLGKELGYEIGKYHFNPKVHTAEASISAPRKP